MNKDIDIKQWRGFDIDPATAEKYINELNKIGCTSFMINKEDIKENIMPILNGKEVNKDFTLDEKENNQFDNVNKPKHYNREGGMQCIEEMELIFGREAVKTFCKLNAWKYRYRAADKNGEEDLRKSDWYLNKYKELVENHPAKYKSLGYNLYQE